MKAKGEPVKVGDTVRIKQGAWRDQEGVVIAEGSFDTKRVRFPDGTILPMMAYEVERIEG